MLHLSVRVVLDSNAFPSNREFELDLVPSDQTGQTFLTDEWTITASLTTPTTVQAESLGQRVEPADTEPVASAILLDDSGSMRFSDPDRQRAAAAERFWTEILAGRPRNLVALLDFGRGGAPPSPGFQQTVLFAGLTADAGSLAAVENQIQAVPGGETPLFESAAEVINWIDSSTPPNYHRSMVLITDGVPSDPQLAESLYTVAAKHSVRIFTVGVGQAAQSDPPSEPWLVLAEIASRSGGIVAAAEPPERLNQVLQTLARSASPTRLLLRLRLDQLPPAGTAVGGMVTVAGLRGTASAAWRFTTP